MYMFFSASLGLFVVSEVPGELGKVLGTGGNDLDIVSSKCNRGDRDLLLKRTLPSI